MSWLVLQTGSGYLPISVADGVPYVPSLDFSDARNSQYALWLFWW